MIHPRDFDHFLYTFDQKYRVLAPQPVVCKACGLSVNPSNYPVCENCRHIQEKMTQIALNLATIDPCGDNTMPDKHPRFVSIVAFPELIQAEAEKHSLDDYSLVYVTTYKDGKILVVFHSNNYDCNM